MNKVASPGPGYSKRVQPRLFLSSLQMIVCLVVTLFLGDAQGAEESLNLIHIKGSNAMKTVVQAWAAAYQAENPGVFFSVDGGGSGNGIAALINGHVTVATTSRPLKAREIRLITQRTGGPPKDFIVGLDALSVVVNKANPINGITMGQLAKIFGGTDGFSTWADLGITIPSCPANTILRLSRKNNSGDYTYFRETVFNERTRFHPNLVTIHQAEKLVERISLSPCAIGFTSMANVTNDVKVLCIARDDNKETPCIPPTAHFTHEGVYPLSRPLYFYMLAKPVPLVQPFIAWVQGIKGQEILRKSGFIAIQESASPATVQPPLKND
ncbi:MAG: phosphate ABC transporter substrate-binding protein [Magnetococcales bacterium]|nr:phosphate ABC transporter substrate-binding protein [Magnetococcales bacterium]